LTFGKSLAAKSLLVISIPLCFQCLLVLTLGLLQMRAEQSLHAVQRSLLSSQAISAVLRDLIEIRVRSMRQGISYRVSGEVLKTQRDSAAQLEKLQTIFKDQPEKLKVVTEVLEHVRLAPKLIVLVGTDVDTTPLDVLVRQLVTDSNNLTNLVRREERFAKEEMAGQKAVDALSQTVLCAGTVIELLLLLFAFTWLRRDIAGRLTLMKENSMLVTMGKPLHETVKGGDELAQLDRVFHSMAEELAEAAEIENILIENVRSVVCALDRKLIFKETNRASSAVFGYQPEELIGMRLAGLLPEGKTAGATDHFEAAKNSTQPPFEIEILSAEGKPVDTLWSIAWSEENSTFICVVHDNSTRKKAERLREGLLQLVGSDLREPLATVNETLLALQKGSYGQLSARGQKLSATATGAAAQMLAITGDLLDINHMEAGTLKIFPRMVLLSEVFKAAVAATSSLASNFGVEIDGQAAELQAFVDPHRLSQILTNLISNAVKFSPRGEKVTLRALPAGDEITIDVIDRGRGIAQSNLSDIFDRFRQVQKSDSIDLKGAGLGLAITKELVMLMGGDITVASVPGEGSTFTVRVPAHGRENRRASEAAKN
jgi:PAS domain S-box-containing protein